MPSGASARSCCTCGSARASSSRRVLAVGPVRGDQQADRAVALVAEQPPASIPFSLLEGTTTGHLSAEAGLLHQRGVPQVDGARGGRACAALPLGETNQQHPYASGLLGHAVAGLEQAHRPRSTSSKRQSAELTSR